MGLRNVRRDNRSESRWILQWRNRSQNRWRVGLVNRAACHVVPKRQSRGARAVRRDKSSGSRRRNALRRNRHGQTRNEPVSTIARFLLAPETNRGQRARRCARARRLPMDRFRRRNAGGGSSGSFDSFPPDLIFFSTPISPGSPSDVRFRPTSALSLPAVAPDAAPPPSPVPTPRHGCTTVLHRSSTVSLVVHLIPAVFRAPCKCPFCSTRSCSPTHRHVILLLHSVSLSHSPSLKRKT